MASNLYICGTMKNLIPYMQYRITFLQMTDVSMSSYTIWKQRSLRWTAARLGTESLWQTLISSVSAAESSRTLKTESSLTDVIITVYHTYQVLSVLCVYKQLVVNISTYRIVLTSRMCRLIFFERHWYFLYFVTHWSESVSIIKISLHQSPVHYVQFSASIFWNNSDKT